MNQNLLKGDALNDKNSEVSVIRDITPEEVSVHVDNCFDSLLFENSIDDCPVYTTTISNENTPQATTSYVARIDPNNANKGYIHHTISSNEVHMRIEVGEDGDMLELPSHATITIETTDPATQLTEVKRYKCDYDGCPRTYSTVGNLRTHMKTHKGEYRFKCMEPACGKAFLTSYSLKIHVRVHTKVKPFNCDHDGCEKSFNTLYRCKESGCGKAFTASHHLKTHRRTHSGHRPCCPQNGCRRTFTTKEMMDNHLLTHHSYMEEDAFYDDNSDIDDVSENEETISRYIYTTESGIAIHQRDESNLNNEDYITPSISQELEGSCDSSMDLERESQKSEANEEELSSPDNFLSSLSLKMSNQNMKSRSEELATLEISSSAEINQPNMGAPIIAMVTEDGEENLSGISSFCFMNSSPVENILSNSEESQLEEKSLSSNLNESVSTRIKQDISLDQMNYDESNPVTNSEDSFKYMMSIGGGQEVDNNTNVDSFNSVLPATLCSDAINTSDNDGCSVERKDINDLINKVLFEENKNVLPESNLSRVESFSVEDDCGIMDTADSFSTSDRNYSYASLGKIDYAFESVEQFDTDEILMDLSRPCDVDWSEGNGLECVISPQLEILDLQWNELQNRNIDLNDICQQNNLQEPPPDVEVVDYGNNLFASNEFQKTGIGDTFSDNERVREELVNHQNSMSFVPCRTESEPEMLSTNCSTNNDRLEGSSHSNSVKQETFKNHQSFNPSQSNFDTSLLIPSCLMNQVNDTLKEQVSFEKRDDFIGISLQSSNDSGMFIPSCVSNQIEETRELNLEERESLKKLEDFITSQQNNDTSMLISTCLTNQFHEANNSSNYEGPSMDVTPVEAKMLDEFSTAMNLIEDNQQNDSSDLASLLLKSGNVFNDETLLNTFNISSKSNNEYADQSSDNSCVQGQESNNNIVDLTTGDSCKCNKVSGVVKEPCCVTVCLKTLQQLRKVLEKGCCKLGSSPLTSLALLPAANYCSATKL
ncbi:hypothetical protein LSTR_LSTR003417 [Laodelphax striatellus]|uniref:C2H2-type domain-containing protein n=1 Tax=Laodelphax striatellus TaxID=195883 RepID=A0A482X2D9_LAOST|nr:hypothetical protein LSTR_LSTR003417 [Laodelphax striatellus]